jgi:opacity protein-like surface antigen
MLYCFNNLSTKTEDADMRYTLLFCLLTALIAPSAAREEVTYDPGEGEETTTQATPAAEGNFHEPGAISAGLMLGYMTWPVNSPYGHDGGGFLVGVSGAYYFAENLAAKLGLDFGLGEYTTLIHVDLGAQYNIPLSETFTAFLGAGIALDMGSWKAFSDNDSDGKLTQVGFNINGGIEFFPINFLALRPTTFFDFAGSVQWGIGLGVNYYF